MTVRQYFDEMFDVCRSLAGEDTGREPRSQSDCNDEPDHSADDAASESGWLRVAEESKGDGVSAQYEVEAGKKVLVPEHWREGDAENTLIFWTVRIFPGQSGNKGLEKDRSYATDSEYAAKAIEIEPLIAVFRQ